MSRELIVRSPVLQRIENEIDGLTLDVVDDAFLVADGIRHVTPSGSVKQGRLVMPLTMQGADVTKPDTHVSFWDGEHPHLADGRPFEALLPIESSKFIISPSFPEVFQLSAKADYGDYYDKVSIYAHLLSREADKKKARPPNAA